MLDLFWINIQVSFIFVIKVAFFNIQNTQMQHKWVQ